MIEEACWYDRERECKGSECNVLLLQTIYRLKLTNVPADDDAPAAQTISRGDKVHDWQEHVTYLYLGLVFNF